MESDSGEDRAEESRELKAARIHRAECQGAGGWVRAAEGTPGIGRGLPSPPTFN